MNQSKDERIKELEKALGMAISALNQIPSTTIKMDGELIGRFTTYKLIPKLEAVLLGK